MARWSCCASCQLGLFDRRHGFSFQPADWWTSTFCAPNSKLLVLEPNASVWTVTPWSSPLRTESRNAAWPCPSDSVPHCAEADSAVDSGKKVLVEGTQGSGLSVYHSAYYPKATSRDTNAAGFLSEVGLSPRIVSE